MISLIVYDFIICTLKMEEDWFFIVIF